jgi:hypothetical protein
VEELVSIELPYYCSSIAYTVAVLSEKQCIVITHASLYAGIEVRDFINPDFLTSNDYKECTEAEFLFQYYTASDNLSEIVKSNIK